MVVRSRSALRWGLLVLGLLALASTATARPRVTGYNPSPVACGDPVSIQGQDFGPRRRGRTVLYGQTEPIGNVALIRAWRDRRIGVTLPARMTPGLYWLGVSNTAGGLASNKRLALQVTCGGRSMTPGPAGVPPPVVVPSEMETFQRRFEREGGGAGMAREIKRRTASEVDFGLRVVEQPREVRIGESFSPILEIHRRNREGLEARLHVMAKADGQSEWQGVRETVPAGQHRRSAPTSIHVVPELVRGGHLRVTYRLENPDGTRWSDADPSNDEITLTVPVPGPVTYRIRATLSNIRIKGDCDNRSWGEWFFTVGLRDQGRSGPFTTAYYPESGVVDLDDGARVTGSPTVSVRNVAFDHVVKVSTGGTDCDRANHHGPRCDGKEDQLLTGLPVGAHTMDIVATDWVLQPAEWRRGAYLRVDLGDSSCGWTGNVRLQAERE